MFAVLPPFLYWFGAEIGGFFAYMALKILSTFIGLVAIIELGVIGFAFCILFWLKFGMANNNWTLFTIITAFSAKIVVR